MSKNLPSIHVLLAELMARSQACGDHEAASAYHASLKEEPWLKLDLVGYQETDSPETKLELRNCPRCGSTLAKRVPT